ncbi:hypothetical protein EON65_42995 [archaeon]|nr:MAG: hypothetical protein EON65_42995 [archaeon]
MDMDENQLLGDDEEASDKEDDEIKPTDVLIALAMTEDDYSHLEIQVMTEEGSLYTHHDILLPDFPLCLAWLDCPPYLQEDGQQNTVGNYMAVGTFSPGIEIWNLDVLDVIEPSGVLGGLEGSSKKKKKNKDKVRYKPGSHEDAVLSLSWNAIFRQAIASGSADSSVKIWDVTSQRCSYTSTHHTDKVQSVLWHYSEAWLLATGSFDKTIALLDCRSAATATVCGLPADVECLAWDPFLPYHLYTSLENGQIICMDIRNCTNNSTKPSAANNIVCQFQAHEKAASSLQFSKQVQGMLATASVDKTVKVWDVSHLHEDMNPVAYKSMSVGKLLAMQFSPNDPFMLATAGDKGMVAIWESDENETIANHFQSRLADKADGEVASELLGIQKKEVDESWMEDNMGIAGAKVDGEKKSKKKKKDKK